MRIFVALLLGLGLLAGCSSVSARKVISLDRFQRIFVEERLNDNNHISDLLVAELRRLGRDASSGPLTMLPQNADAVLSYDTRWTWDFHTYLIELNVELRTAHSDKKVADGRYYQPSIKTKSPEAVIHEVLARMFAP
jgi:hypothetical protein